MYALISTDRDELNIVTQFFNTQKEAHNTMVKEILEETYYESVADIVDAADAGECGFSDNDAWAEGRGYGTVQWNIVKVPEKVA